MFCNAMVPILFNEKVPITKVVVSAYTIPTDRSESDGTFEWDSTTVVLVEVSAGGKTGLGYSYANQASGEIVRSVFAQNIEGCDALSILGCWQNMARSARNLGRPGVASCAISAVDTALWDLKARLLGISLVHLFGAVRKSVPVYGSGGFTSYSENQLVEQMAGWVEQGIQQVKMKIGRHALADRQRVKLVREAIGDRAKLFVDANGAYARKQALEQAEYFAECGVSWFEEPVSSDDLEGLRLIRNRAPVGMEIAAGEYGYDAFYFQRMITAEAVDVLQADATRCAGYTGFLLASALCQANQIPLSAHTAPALHTHVCCSAIPVRHVEYFHDHAQIEQFLFDGLPELKNGELHPDFSRPGNGLELKLADAKKFAA